MCGGSLTPVTPSVTTTVKVEYLPDQDRWHAQLCLCSVSAEGDYVTHGSLGKEFGPFDGLTDVLQWTYREVAALIRSMPGRGDPKVTR